MKTFIVIGGAGRCGTTSLLSHLNQKPNFHIYGENYGGILSLLQTIKLCDDTIKKNTTSKKYNSKINYANKRYAGPEWYNPTIKDLTAQLKNCLINFFDPNAQYVGFKDIRWSNNSIYSLNILENYFKVKYIYLLRDINKQYESIKRLKWDTINKKDIINTNYTFKKFLASKKSNQYIIKNISIDHNFLNEIYNFIIQE